MLLHMAWFCSLSWLVMFRCIYVLHLPYPLTCNRHLGCFPVLVIVHSAAVNTGLHVSCWIIVLPRSIPHAKSWLIGKNSDAGRDWGQEEKGTTEDERAGWHHWLDGCKSEWTPGVGDGQGGQTQLSDWTELNWCPEVELLDIWSFYF